MSVDITPTDDYVLYADTKKSLAGLNKRMLFFLLPLVVLAFIFGSVFAHGFAIPRHGSSGQPLPPVPIHFDPAMAAFLSWFPWFLLAECAFLYVVMARSPPETEEADCRPELRRDRGGHHGDASRSDPLGRDRGSPFLHDDLPLRRHRSEEHERAVSTAGRKAFLGGEGQRVLHPAVQAAGHLRRADQYPASLSADHRG